MVYSADGWPCQICQRKPGVEGSEIKNKLKTKWQICQRTPSVEGSDKKNIYLKKIKKTNDKFAKERLV